MASFAAVGAAIGWFGLVLQFVLILGKDDGFDALGHTVNFFSYFTILSNILVACVLTSAATGRGPRFLRRPPVMAAAALYIVITGLTYTFILAGIWAPQGWDKVADSTLHYAMPVVYAAFWVLFAPKAGLSVRVIPWMLVFPIAYGVYSMIRGPIAEWYPYPFLDLRLHGWGQVALNIVLMAVGFAVVAWALVTLSRWLPGSRSATARA